MNHRTIHDFLALLTYFITERSKSESAAYHKLPIPSINSVKPILEEPEIAKKKEMKDIVQNKFKIGPKFGKCKH